MAEDRFLKDVADQFERFDANAAPQELQNWGGWWRNRFRENPDKAQRVLVDVGSMIKEGTVHSNPGEAAMDLWRRLP